MLISYYEEGSLVPKKASGMMTMLIALNFAFVAMILFAWTYVALFVAEPLAWATWLPISRGSGPLGMFEYPFAMLWFLPLLGISGAWVSLKGGRKTMAYGCVAVPVIMFSMIMGWFYLVQTW